MLLIYLLLFASFLGFLIYRKRLPYYKLAEQIGGPKGYPVIGSALDFLKNLDRTLVTLSNWVDEFGDRFVLFLGPTPVFLVNNAEDMEKICMSNEIIDKSPEYDMVHAWLGQGLITSTGSLWQARRKLITPCFHFTLLEKFIGPINKQAEMFGDVLKANFIGREGFQDITMYVARCTLDIICETSMGNQMNSQSGTDCEYVEAVHKMGKLFQHRSIRPWLRNNFIWNLTSQGREEARVLKYIHDFTDQVIEERRQQMNNSMQASSAENSENTGRVRKALLDMLLDAQQADQQSISDIGLRDEITTFIFAGHDTISATVSFCLYCLGNHPEIQSKVHQEIDSIFSDDPTRPVTSADLRSLKYLEFCLKESMRMYPSVPLIGREVTTPFRLDDQTLVPSGVVMYMFPYKLHRNPKYFVEPDKYIPERFDPENDSLLKGKNTFAYIPFSAGYRNCIGQKLAMMEAKIILATILRRFKLKSEYDGEKLNLLSEIVLRAKDGLKMKLELR